MKKGKIALFALLLLIGLVPTIIAFMFPPHLNTNKFEGNTKDIILSPNKNDPTKLDTLDIQ